MSHFVLFCPCPCPLSSSSLWSWACDLFTRMSGSDVDFCPCFQHVPMGQPPHPSVLQITQHCAVRALMSLLAVLPPHVCRQRDWTVSIGSHMQQDMDISRAPPHRSAPIPLFEHRSRLKTTIQKIGDNFPLRQRCLVKVFQPGATCAESRTHAHRAATRCGHSNHAHMHIGNRGRAVTVERKKFGRGTRAVTVKRK